MSLLTYKELIELISSNVIDAPVSAVNGSSIDVTLQPFIRKERFGSDLRKVRLFAGENIETVRVDITDSQYILMPDAVMLASTVEMLRMPLDLSAEFSLKSTLARNFLCHELAGWIDPGFNGRLTLELKNHNQFHKLVFAPGMPIGQIKFFRGHPVPVENSYIKKGQYNGQIEVTPAGVLT